MQMLVMGVGHPTGLNIPGKLLCKVSFSPVSLQTAMSSILLPKSDQLWENKAPLQRVCIHLPLVIKTIKDTVKVMEKKESLSAFPVSLRP